MENDFDLIVGGRAQEGRDLSVFSLFLLSQMPSHPTNSELIILGLKEAGSSLTDVLEYAASSLVMIFNKTTYLHHKEGFTEQNLLENHIALKTLLC